MEQKPVALIVEVDSWQLMMAGELAEEAGCEPVLACNADEEMVILQARNDVRVLVTDVNMPSSMDGLRLAQTVCDRWSPIKIVFVSGHVQVDEARLPKRAQLMSKPYLGDAMISALKSATLG